MLKPVKKEQGKVSLYSNILMILTSVHHAYGAVVYHTPWRMHILFMSVPMILVTLLLNRVLQQKADRSGWAWVFGSLVLLLSVMMIGTYEGLYNHVLKNVLYFGGLSARGMAMFFPPSMYELPNDALFEVTGMLQGVVVIPLVIHFIGWVRGLLNSTT
ncbi:hypothetical protein [Chitinophaga arvensicola]|uniref:Uncharacterized protein n=1 Tax=Chitinophaga arvensicola TaxID=29529 RepID=A0A1I0RHS7_9BACT|nr:hypothetical protein [Chitinophaga arvensicola]SEW39809.1 hypothetical protein SAMN04488122_2786 [Chitinophaga arvensicola]